jgi:competence protein ComFC
MKYQDQHILSVPLGRLIAQKLKKVGDFSGYRVTFVPVDKKRGRYRGYNQAKLLAHVVADTLKIECQETLVRDRETESQIYADSYRERRKNVKQSIRAIDIVQGNFLLIDDVITSGATIEEAAKVLFRAGAQKVIAASVCLG